MSSWFRNGKPVRTVAIDNRAFQYGDGLFETIAIRDGRPRLWTLHLERLAAGCRRLAIDKPADRKLRDLLGDALAQSNQDLARCTAKILLSGPGLGRGYARDVSAETSTFIGVFLSDALDQGDYRDGVDTIVCDTRLALFSATAGLKTLNRLEQVLARSECARTSAFEGLTLDADGQLICGTMSNVFLVSDSSIVTPSLSRCGVAGVMRRHTIDTLRANSMPVTIRDVNESEIWSCDEMFLTNSQFGILPVRRCGNKTWSAHRVAHRVMAIMSTNGVLDCAL